jgi:hypothetical protein
MKNEIIEMIPYSFKNDMLLVCSLGLNVGFIIALLFM